MGLLSIEEELEETRKALQGVGVTAEDVAKEAARGIKDSLLTPAAVEEAAMPMSPKQQAIEEYGKGGYLMRKLATKIPLLTPSFVDDMILPQLSRENRDKYASDMKIHRAAALKRAEKMAELDVMDPQVEDYARMVERDDPLKAAAIRAANKVDAWDPNGYTLAPGGRRHNALDQLVAVGGNPVVTPTAVMQNARETARGYGIPLDSKAYSDLVAAYAEPSGSQTLADGTVVPFNTVDKVLADWRSGVYGQSNQAAGGQAGGANIPGVTAGGGVTTQGATDATVRKVMNDEIAENLKISDQKISFYDDLERVIGNFGVWDPKANDGVGGFAVSDATLDNYGAWDNHPLNLGSYKPFKGTGEKDALVFMDQLVEMLTVDERGKLKGQGQITEGETEMLRRATTALRNRDLSDRAVQREIEVLMRGLISRRLKFQELQKQYGKDGKGGNTDDFDTMWENS